MKILHLFFLYFVCFVESYGQAVAKNYYGQIKVEITKERKPRRIYAKVEITPPFPLGDTNWVKSLEKNINQSLKFRNGAKKGKYFVLIKFIVSKDGQLSEVICDKDPGFGMAVEVMNVVKKAANISSKWTSAPANGRKVSEIRH